MRGVAPPWWGVSYVVRGCGTTMVGGVICCERCGTTMVGGVSYVVRGCGTTMVVGVIIHVVFYLSCIYCRSTFLVVFLNDYHVLI